MGTPCPDTGLHSLARAPDDDAGPMLGRLLEGWKKPGLTRSELGMPELLWQMLKEDHQRLREVDPPEGIYYVKPESAPANCVP